MSYDYSNKNLDQYATTKAQKAALEARRQTSSILEAALLINKSESTIHEHLKKIRKLAAERESEQHDASANQQVPDGYHIKGCSTMVTNAEGRPMWIKTDKDKEQAFALFEQAIMASLERVKPLPKVPKPSAIYSDDLMVVIPIGDAHIGMLAWGEECGADYDLSIAEAIHMQAIDTLIAEAPAAKTCAIIDVGDFVHADNLMGVTSRSGHNLDMDGRFHKVVRVVCRIVLYYIEKALEKYEQVIYRPEVGNHNDVGAIWIQEWLSAMFSKNERVTIGNTPGNHFFWQHGLCFFGSHHGHEMKPDALKDKMNNHIIDNCIKTKFRKWFCGHIHHSTVKDANGVIVETYATLAAKDAYSASHGYEAERAMCAEVWHKTKGQLRVLKFGAAMLKQE